MHLIISLFHFKSFLYLLTRKYTISCFLEIAHLSCACIFFCVGSHARLRCMCTCNRCTFCLCQNFLNSELVQTVRTKLYTVVFSRFSGWFYLASLLFLYFYISLLNSSLFIHFIYHPDSHSFSFISAFWFGLINFWLYRLYENAMELLQLWHFVDSFLSWAVDFWMDHQAFLDTISIQSSLFV